MTKAMIVLLVLLITPDQVRGELYQYRGSDGSVIITDDVNNVPEDQRERARVKETAPPASTGRDAAVPPERKTRKRKPVQPAEDGVPRVPMRAAGAVPTDVDGRRSDSEEIKQRRAWNSLKSPDSDPLCKDPKSDPRFATPEATWSAFKDALMNSDLETTFDCFQPESAKRYREAFTGLGRDKMADMGRNMRPIHRIAQDDKKGKFWTRKNEFGQEITYYIYFVCKSGDWKIDQF